MLDHEELRKNRIAEAADHLAEKDKDLGRFADELFSHGLAEDINRYHAEDLAAFASSTYKAMTKRKPGTPIVQFGSHTVEGAGFKASALKLTTITIVNDNMPFLVDSVIPEMRELSHEILLIVHPIFAVERDEQGVLKKTPELFSAETHVQRNRESVLHIHIPEIPAAEIRVVKAALASLLKDVRGIVRDWRKMTDRLESTIRHYKTNPPPIEVTQLAEAVQFLEWLTDNNFTFLGLREMRYDDTADRFVQPVKGSGLGILRNPDVHVLKRGNELVEITPEIREFMTSADPLIISKANVKSRVHRRIHMDYIGVKLYDATGMLTGELRIVGLFTSTVYARSIMAIPYLRHKANNIIKRSGFDANSHSGKALWNVLESYPRDELFQIAEDLLEEFALAVLALDGRAKVRVLPRWDKFDRYVSVIVFVPRDRYNTDVRIRIGEHLSNVYNGSVSAFYPGFPEGLLARVHFIVRRETEEQPDVNRPDLEARIEEIVSTWPDRLSRLLATAEKTELANPYLNAFSAAYREAYSPAEALNDLGICETLTSPDVIAVDIYRRDDMDGARIGLKVFHLDSPIELSQRVPLLENLGFRVINERTYKIAPMDGPARYLHDMTLLSATGDDIDLSAIKDRLSDAILAIWQDRTGNDGYNALILNAGLVWRDVALLRTISRYLQQIGVTYSQHYMWEALNKNAEIAGKLVDLFHARFDPAAKARDKAQKTLSEAIDHALDQVTSLDEDQIVRRFRDVIMGTVRTNFFKRTADGMAIPEVSLKLAPREIEGLPEPRPFREIFMTSPRVEGLHLRFGKVARGGLRWSDRPEDFRTEVLGLVKAQQVKNAVIVPVGSKGGFVPKKLTPQMSRDVAFETGRDAYKIFISNLLELTDNLDGDDVVHPKKVIRHEDDDPYLVVAADKGTATFSDTANGISADYDFWLDDAFASGGSAGYDHKKMGITARGAWEAVKRHFREMDKDIQTEPFTVAGIGDMSGDVFGNGMLLSKAIKLVAAFDHRDIFIDPDPDPAKSWDERKRVFDLGRSSWNDYDTSLISEGGGIFSRAAKSIPLTREMQKLLNVKKSAMTPVELMQAIIKINVELFWFGGIGTYVRGPLETNADAGDRANDPIRIAAADLGAKVVGEGANLGMTQRARIAFNKRGGRCNSDAIDNSAGVNSSDVEVNIKIALGSAMRTGKLDLKKRNKILESMTDDVAALCLRNNYQQSLSISLTEVRGWEDFGHQARYMQDLEARGLLDRAVEDLPGDQALDERRQNNEPLTRAEIGVILAYAKITLFDDLIESDLPDDPYLERELMRYFPKKMQKDFADEIRGHRLGREIIATQISNTMINRGGATYLERVTDRTGRSTVDIARAYIVVRDAFVMQDLNARIDALDTKIAGKVQLDLYAAVQNLLLGQTVNILRSLDLDQGLETSIAPIAKGVKALKAEIVEMLPKYLLRTFERNRKSFLQAKVPADLATDIALLPILGTVPGIIAVSERAKRPLIDTARTYFAIAGMFQIGRIEHCARMIDVTDYYEGLALERTRFQLASAHRAITLEALSLKKTDDPATAWKEANAARIEQVTKTVSSILESETFTPSKVAVATNLIDDLVEKM
ncbi:MAG: NAD-glutamate dehydrogenase [Pseudomonadota bacterium]